MIYRFYLCIIMCCLLLGACSKDKCKDNFCLHDGFCEDGSCNCGDWYTGNNCEDELREQFYGEYEGFLSIGSTSSASNISYYSSTKGVQFMSFGFTGYLELQPNGDFTIPIQNLNLDGESFFVEGTGSFTDNQVNMTFTGTRGTETATFTYLGIK